MSEIEEYFCVTEFILDSDSWEEYKRKLGAFNAVNESSWSDNSWQDYLLFKIGALVEANLRAIIFPDKDCSAYKRFTLDGLIKELANSQLVENRKGLVEKLYSFRDYRNDFIHHYYSSQKINSRLSGTAELLSRGIAEGRNILKQLDQLLDEQVSGWMAKN